MKRVEENIVLLWNQHRRYADREGFCVNDPLLADFGGTRLALMNELLPWIKGVADRGYVGESVPHFAGVCMRAKVNQFLQASQ